MQTAVRTGMSLAEFLEQSAQQDFELIDGERRVKVPPVSGHSEIIRFFFRLLDLYCLSNRIGETYSETTFILPDRYNSSWVEGSRIPDIMLFFAQRLADYKINTPEWRLRPFALIPDFVIEVISPNDPFSQVMEKAERYLSDGVRLVWVIDMQRKSALIFTPDAETVRTLKGDALLTAEDLLPGFSVKLSDVFV